MCNVTKSTKYHCLSGRGYGQVTVLKFCCDAAYCAGSSATAELLVFAICCYGSMW